MAEPAVKSRRRLRPDERIQEILDAAAELVVETGIAQLNMEKIARRAGVSKGLLYAYFPNVKTLLQEVLLREHRKLQRAQLDAITSAVDFESMAKSTAHNNHVQRTERGLLVERLRGDPEVAGRMVDVDRKSREGVIDYLTGQVTMHFAIPEQIARLATSLIIGPGQGNLHFAPGPVEDMDEIWGAMMVGAMKELERRFGGGNANE
ncbi:MAG: TetR/AcrR family transcriptional regulator [Pseudomonadales bacterium]|nr:TetR/AcrR family transcriptional regulator [Pseudomonadales bacterium]